MTKEEFIELLKYNGWKAIYSRDVLNRPEYRNHPLQICMIKDSSVIYFPRILWGENDDYIYSDDGYKPNLILPFTKENTFIEIMIKMLDLKSIPKIETIEDYIKANFILSDSTEPSTEKDSFYKFGNYEIRIDNCLINIYYKDVWIGHFSKYYPNLEHQIKILNAFLERDPDNN